jgi:hypothetical protein
MSLNIQRLIDAGFTDEDIRVVFTAFEATMSEMNKAIEEMKDKLPFSDEMIKGANRRSEEIIERIKLYKQRSTNDIDQLFGIWAQMAINGDAD